MSILSTQYLPSLIPTPPAATPPPLRDAVKFALENYLQQLGDQPPHNVYELIVAECEISLFEVMLKYTYHNQKEAAQLLGLSRTTLRQKLRQHGMLRAKRVSDR